MKDYAAALEFLFSQLPMFQRVGNQAIKKDLTNIRLFLEELKHPERRFPSIHIAGTNGKGSVTHIIAGILMGHGLKVGIYTSPHYKDFRERIKINGQFVEKDFIVNFLNDHQDYIARLKPSFFEMGVAMAFEYFAQVEVDIAVVETGLGGLLDSTNVLDPEVAVITNISKDHEEMLGSTIPEIATQKAGIIKPGRPVVIGEYQEDTWPVFESTAKENQAPVQLAKDLIHVELSSQDLFGSTFTCTTKDGTHIFETDMKGPFLQKNLNTGLAAILTLDQVTDWFNLDWENLGQLFPEISKATYYIGRWHLLGQNPLTIGDSGHNKAGFEGTFNAIHAIPHQQLHLVLGFTAEKDIREMLNILPQTAVYYFCKADVPKGLKASKLKDMASEFDLEGEAYSSVSAALEGARKAASSEDIIFVGGSIFVLAEVL